MKEKAQITLQQAREAGELDKFAEQHQGKAEVPNPKSRFERLLDLMARRSSKEDAGT